MATIKFKRGGATPTGLTAGEPAWKFSTNQVYLGVTADAIWVGAKIEDTVSWASGSTLMLATQNAINTEFMPRSGGTFTGIIRVQNQIGVCFGDADSSNYIGLRAPTTVGTNYTLTLPTTAGSASEVLSTDGSGNLSWIASGSATTVTVSDLDTTNTTIYLAGATSAGSRTLLIDTSGLTYNASTNLLANNGGLNLGGNLTVAGTSTLTGNVTASGNLTVTGDLTINGTTTTVNSNTMTVDDPVIVLGTSGGLPISASDSAKDRGVVFTYYDTAGRTGFFGFDASTTRFTYVAIGATLTNEIVTGGTAGDAQFRSLYLTMPSGAFVGGLTLTTLAANRTYTLPDVDGTIVTTGDTGTVTSAMILDGTIVNADISASAGIVDTKLAQIITANKVGLTALDIDGAGDIGKSLTDGDLIIVDDGGAGVNKKAAVSRIPTYVFSKITGDLTINSSGVATIASNGITLGTDTTGQYASTIASSGSGLLITTPNADDGTAYTISLTKINTGIDFGTFAFTTNEFTNTSGTVAIGTVDGGSY